MIDPKRLAFDIDGVLANTMQLFLDILKKVDGVNHIAYDQITQYQLEDCLVLLKGSQVGRLHFKAGQRIRG